jgi:hypothetical protein
MKFQLIALHQQPVRVVLPRYHIELSGELFLDPEEAELNNPVISAAGSIFFLADIQKIEGQTITLK